MPEDQRRALTDLFRDANKIALRPTAIARRATTGTTVLTDRGCRVAVSAGITIPANVYAAGDWFQLYNDSAAAVTVTQGASLTLRLDGTTVTGDRVLAPRESAMVWFNSATEAAYAQTGSAASALLTSTNYLLNGNFDAALNVGPLTLLNNGNESLSFDAWTLFQNTAATAVASQVASGLTGYRKALKIGRPNGDTSTNAIIAISSVKTIDSIPLQGQTVTFSFWAKAGANFSGSNLSVRLATGTGTDELPGGISGWTGVLNPINTTQVITSSWAQYSFTTPLSATETQIGIRVFYVPAGTAGADDNAYLTGVRIQQGLVATGPDAIPYRDTVNQLRPHGYCGGCITNFGGGGDPFSQCQFISRNGNTVLINGNYEIIPQGVFFVSGGVTATYSSCTIDGTPASALAANTDYYIYATMVAGAMTLNFSTAHVPALSNQYGLWVKADDAASTLVGFLHTNAASKSLGNAQAQTIISYYNRLRYRLSATISGNTTSATWVELSSANRLEWVQWDDDLPSGPASWANIGTSASPRTAELAIGMNSSTTPNGDTWIGITPSTASPSMTATPRALNNGNSAKGNYYYATSLAQVSGGATLTVVNGSMCLDNIAV